MAEHVRHFAKALQLPTTSIQTKSTTDAVGVEVYAASSLGKGAGQAGTYVLEIAAYTGHDSANNKQT